MGTHTADSRPCTETNIVRQLYSNKKVGGKNVRGTRIRFHSP